MAKAVKITGLDKVVKGLNKSLKKIKNKTVAGMLEAAVLVKGESLRITPIDTGNLRNSAYITWGGGKVKTRSRIEQGTFDTSDKSGAKVATEHNPTVERRKSIMTVNPFAEIGYTAHYAAAVHEAPQSRKFTVGQSKFLEQALRNNSRNIFKIIQRRASIV
jgi:hypothetical protein|tara:strand:+ start:310 stop:792 length:483 start_codon:yes stop_codon:yes gene_type:complete